MGLFLVVPQVLVIGFRPLRPADRVNGKLVKGLAEKLGAGKAEMDPFGFSAGLLHGCYPAIALQLVSTLVAITLCSEGYDQPRGQRGASPGQGGKQRAIGVGTHELLN